jgi:iron complex transport system ATP-binding protein
MGMITARGVRAEQEGRVILEGVDLEIRDGEVLVLVGPNGAGKSTLLSILSGEHRPAAGEVAVDGRPIGEYDAEELARARAVFTQENAVSFPFRVAEVVAMGRAPWARTVQSRSDVRIVAESLAAADVADLASRRMTHLSGGEKARVALARVLAQRANTVLLDEPTAALDLRHEEEVMGLARVMASEGRAVCVVLHDLALAAAYADRMALIAHGRVIAVGSPREVLTEALVSDAYGLAVRILDVDGVPTVVPRRSLTIP